MTQDEKSVTSPAGKSDPESVQAAPVEVGVDLAGVVGDVSALGVGGQIQAARLAKKMSLADVSQVIKISPRVLEQVEANAWGELSGRTFARGVVRSYAKLVQLDPEPLLKELESAPLPKPPTLNLPRSTDAALPVPGEAHRRDLVAMVGGVLLVALAIVAYYLIPDDWFSTQGNRISGAEPVRELVLPAASTVAEPVAVLAPTQVGTVDPAPPVAVMDSKPAPEEKATAKRASKNESEVLAEARPERGLEKQADMQANKPAIKPVGAKFDGPAARVSEGQSAELSMRFEESSWVEVRDQNGEILLSDTVDAGVTRKIAAAPPVTLWLGNAEGVRVQYRGAPVDLRPHTRQKVARLTLE